MKPTAVTILILIALAVLGCGGDEGSAIVAQAEATSLGTVLYFFDPDCPDCREAEREHLEPLAAMADCPLELIERINVTEPAGARRLFGLKPAAACKALAPVLVMNQKVLCGIDEIRNARQ